MLKKDGELFQIIWKKYCDAGNVGLLGNGSDLVIPIAYVVDGRTVFTFCSNESMNGRIRYTDLIELSNNGVVGIIGSIKIEVVWL
jgi:hypothetical protein